MAGPVDDFPILLRLVYILVACSMFDHVFFLIHTFENSVGDGSLFYHRRAHCVCSAILGSRFTACITRSAAW